jgi:hypothetical protein
MTAWGRAREALIEPSNANSLVGRARLRRWATFNRRFPELATFRVLDLGGTLGSWMQSPVMPRELVILNLDVADRTDTHDGATSVRYVTGDACTLPPELVGQSFDLVFSNSVIEHVGGHARRLDFAESVRSAAPRCWIQTPYRYFPIEPHFAFPVAQFLPISLRAQLPQRWPLGFEHAGDRQSAIESAQQIELLSITEMRAYFPDAELVLERILGIPKSIVVIRT